VINTTPRHHVHEIYSPKNIHPINPYTQLNKILINTENIKFVDEFIALGMTELLDPANDLVNVIHINTLQTARDAIDRERKGSDGDDDASFPKAVDEAARRPEINAFKIHLSILYFHSFIHSLLQKTATPNYKR
jgi:hypothetical protein